MIPYSDMLAITEVREDRGDPVPFSFTYIKADLKRRTGGDAKTISCAVRVGGSSDGTLNYKMLPSGLIRKAHLRLITEINGEKVYY